MPRRHGAKVDKRRLARYRRIHAVKPKTARTRKS